MVDYDIIKQDSFSRKTIFLCLLPIGIIGLLVRMYFEPYVALTGDATNYFVYAADTGLKGKLSDVYFLANSGWSLLLSSLFSITKYDDPLFLMELQHSLSIFISEVNSSPLFFGIMISKITRSNFIIAILFFASKASFAVVIKY